MHIGVWGVIYLCRVLLGAVGDCWELCSVRLWVHSLSLDVLSLRSETASQRPEQLDHFGDLTLFIHRGRVRQAMQWFSQLRLHLGPVHPWWGSLHKTSEARMTLYPWPWSDKEGNEMYPESTHQGWTWDLWSLVTRPQWFSWPEWSQIKHFRINFSPVVYFVFRIS